MNLKEYLIAVADKIEKAGNEGNREEAIRLFNLIIGVCNDNIKKIEWS